MNGYRRVAVVGSGISGAAAAWLLRSDADTMLFEADRRFGGHTHTYQAGSDTDPIAIDTGFMVFNRPNYPLLTALFEQLNIASYPTAMSFSASFNAGQFEYAGSNLNTLFGQRRNLISPRFLGILSAIVRFNKLAAAAVRSPLPTDLTLGEFLDRARLGHAFRDCYLYPMAAAIWSCPHGQMARFPALSFLRFFSNHGLIKLAGRPQWQTVEGGASRYMDRLIADLGPRARMGTPVVAVRRDDSEVVLRLADGQQVVFDDVVLACHSDQALALLSDPSPVESSLLAAIPYQSNRALLHRDADLMPHRRRVWSSWNYCGSTDDRGLGDVSVTYWMNSLQRLSTEENFFVSLNPVREPRPELVVDEFEYHHPVFDAGALAAQRQLHTIQGTRRTWFAGAWTGYGFHEDGLRSAVDVATALGAPMPWAERVRESRALTVTPQLAGQLG